ncbi:MAG: right-handed parallel beta-helix repeat-containing protein [Chloroflexota bacterium]|nr:right-handed parallel beta-helix repeat-containing protein [Chloroflexota bacterium]
MEAGVQVNLGDRFIQVEGTLQVLGTSRQSVKITGLANTDYPKLIFKANSTSWDEDTQSGSIIRNAIIQGQTYAASLIEMEDSSPKIVDSTIINNNSSSGAISSLRGSPKIISNRISAYYGVSFRGSGFPQIIGNRIEGKNSFNGISLLLSQDAKSHVRIEGNLITGFQNGILVHAFDDSHQIDITSNHITKNQVGILIGGDYKGTSSSPPLFIRMNAIRNNRWNARTENTPGKAYNVDMSNNWWGTTDSAAIEATLYHYPQDFRLSRIIYTSFLSELPRDVPLP